MTAWIDELFDDCESNRLPEDFVACRADTISPQSTVTKTMPSRRPILLYLTAAPKTGLASGTAGDLWLADLGIPRRTSALGTIMMVLTFMGFTLVPECCAYWVGEVGQPPNEDRAKRLVKRRHRAYGQELGAQPGLLRPVTQEELADAQSRLIRPLMKRIPHEPGTRGSVHRPCAGCTPRRFPGVHERAVTERG
ncbi:MAG: hypothetical protein H0X67_03695 [Acidobacteria bacterium]|nr:hypothetical protein [Acidobacteriota bacterium]